jgi:voltage-gated potassium channel
MEPFSIKVETPLWKLARSWVKKNLMMSVIGFLMAAWFVVGYFVYLFENSRADANIHSFADGLWWGVVTFLTVGYGDRYPVTVEGRLIAVFLMVTGVITMSIVTAKISTYFLEQALAKGRSTVTTEKLKNHFVICGWKEDMEDLLQHILANNHDLEAKDIVVVANVVDSVLTAMKQNSILSDVQWVVGDYIHESQLRRAAPEKARRVLILADQTPLANGQKVSESEVDARTIMAAMTLSHFARGTLVAAEIYDPKMDHYLKIANVSEIIYTREYSRLIIGSATAGTGVANVLYEILSPQTAVKISTTAIGEEFLGKSYADLSQVWMINHPNSVLLGILENTGNSDSIRSRALRNAQKTANMSDLVENLRKVKSLKFNNPVFSPPGNYLIHEGCLAIVLESHGHKESYERSTPAAA